MPTTDERREVAARLRWKAIDEFPNYEVSDCGDIRNITTGKLLSPYKNQRGYMKVCLYVNGKKKYLSVHRLVANAFVANDRPDTNAQVNHIDEDKTNNCAENLEWVTPKGNVNHGTCIERRAKAQSRTVEMTYGEITVLFDSTRDASERTGIPRKNIQGVCRGKCKTTRGASFRYINGGEKIIEPEERTCRHELTIGYDPITQPTWSHGFSCGHSIETTDNEPPRYCPECGAKVVE